ncbi:DDE superfamily endonuclease, partial [Alysiella filiformis DSM 16848]
IGRRCYATYDWQIRKQTNAIGALLNGRLFTVALFHHTINRAVFIQWLKEDLIPKLNKKSVLIMDNARFHVGKKRFVNWWHKVGISCCIDLHTVLI